MKELKVLELDRIEQGIVINALNEFRTKLLKEGKDTTPVDEVLLRTLDAPNKKRMFHRREEVDER